MYTANYFFVLNYFIPISENVSLFYVRTFFPCEINTCELDSLIVCMC